MHGVNIVGLNMNFVLPAVLPVSGCQVSAWQTQYYGAADWLAINGQRS